MGIIWVIVMVPAFISVNECFTSIFYYCESRIIAAVKMFSWIQCSLVEHAVFSL